MKNFAIVIMVLIIGVLAVVVGKTTARLKWVAANNETAQIRGYLDLVERYTKIADDPSRTGAAAVLYAKHLFKTAPPETAIAYFDDVLSQTKDPTVQRAIRLELVELYLHEQHPNSEKAMEQLRVLMGAAPTTHPVAVAP